MPKLSDLPGTTPRGVLVDKHVPFTAFLKAYPVQGKRSEMARSLERQSSTIEDQLLGACGGVTYDITFDYSTPIAYTFQFGQQTARFTINGHACKRTEFTKTPVGEQLVVSNNHELIGVGAANASNMTPDTDLNAISLEIRNLLENLTGLKCYRLKIAGYIYGTKGVHFP